MAESVEAAGRRAVAVPADLSDLEAVAGLVDRARDAFGRLDLVVNNVGGAMPRAFMDTSPGRLEQAFHFNVSTAHALLRPAVPLMLEGGGGSVVNISSAMGRLAGRGYLAYGTAKGALAHYTRLAAADLAPRIRVNAIAVGSVATSALDIVMQTDELRVALEEGTPLKRIGRARGHRRRHRLPGLGGRRLRHRQDPRGRRRHRGAQPRHGHPRRMTGTSDPIAALPDVLAERSTVNKTYRVVAWSTGNVGRHAIAGIDARPDLELVGLWVSNPDKVGRDAG